MEDPLSDDILTNPFTSSLLAHRIDGPAFERLCESLRQLAARWKDQRRVEKVLVSELYVTATVVRNVRDHFRANGDEARAEELEAMYVEIDRLIMEECLAGRL